MYQFKELIKIDLEIMDRQSFLKFAGAGILLTGSKMYGVDLSGKNELKRIVILHTNDWHSRIEPFPNDKSKNSDLGGASRRAGLIKQIRNEEKNVLVFDSGDIFQGTPYFNYFGGSLEMKLMSEMGYNAATMGNHDFDGTMDGFKKSLENCNFDFICSNYDFKDTVLDGLTIPYKTITIDGIKIGICSSNIELKGLVPDKLFKSTKFLDPIETTNHYAELLKKEEKCNYVICLSHLGYRYEEDKISDIVLAKNSSHIDLILGGHTHTFMKEPDTILNKKDNKVLVTQAGWGGILLGRLDITFDHNKKAVGVSNDYIISK